MRLNWVEFFSKTEISIKAQRLIQAIIFVTVVLLHSWEINITMITTPILLFFLYVLQKTLSFPLLLEIEPRHQRCFHITLPDDDDFNLVVTAIPNPHEGWF